MKNIEEEVKKKHRMNRNSLCTTIKRAHVLHRMGMRSGRSFVLSYSISIHVSMRVIFFSSQESAQ